MADTARTAEHASPCPAAFLQQIGAKRDGHQRGAEREPEGTSEWSRIAEHLP